MSNEQNDVEALLFPTTEELRELRWAFIRKVYTVLTFQLLATAAVAALVVQHPSIAVFFRTYWFVYVLVVITSFIVTGMLNLCQIVPLINYFMLGIFVLCFGFTIGLIASFVNGVVILAAAIATAVAVVSLILYTFWAAKKEDDFGFLKPFVFSLVIILLTFSLFLILFPVWRSVNMIYSGIVVVSFTAYVIFDSDALMKLNTDEQFIWASIVLYVDMFNIIIRLLQIIRYSIRQCCSCCST